MLLVVDNGSVYTQSLVDCIKRLDIEFECRIFTEFESINLDNYHSIVLSGRRKNNPLMNAINSRLVKHAMIEHKPLLGICYGAEILALTLGGTIKKMMSSRQGLYEIDITKDNPLCGGKLHVFESHSYMISKLSPLFIQLGTSTDCNFEMFQYNNTNIFGTQFHPEMSKDGKSLLERFSFIK